LFRDFIHKLKNSTFITLETTPPHSAKFSHIVTNIEQLGLHELVDGFTTTDNPLAKLKYNSLFASKLLQDRFKKVAIATMSMRDRNKIALQSDLLGANEFDVRAILALTGDSASISDQPKVKGVFEQDSSLLLDIITSFNSGKDYAQKEFKYKPDELYPFAVINSSAKNPKTLQKKMQKKLEHGAIAIISQPLFDTTSAKILLELMGEANNLVGKDGVLVQGFFPITKLRTAEFLTNHVPGINVPPKWIDELRLASRDGLDMEYKVGFELSYELFYELKKLHPKIHLMSANQFQIAKDILK
jgi:5,10-methylenetetrahydrofolate reductase